MSMTDHDVSMTPKLFMAFELGWSTWKLAFTVGLGQKPRLRTVAARDMKKVLAEIEAARQRFDLPEDAAVTSCYEAGRDGFWLHRCLESHGIDNLVVDSASIEVSRRKRKPKTDRLDASKLVAMLVRHHLGESVWSVVRVPSEEAEDARHLHRALKTLKGESTRCVNRIRGLLANHGLSVGTVDASLPGVLKRLRRWDGSPIPEGLRQRIMIEYRRLRLVRKEIQDLGSQRRKRLREGQTVDAVKARKLQRVRGIGDNGSWLLAAELFAPKQFANRKQVASMVGLTPTPFDSGGSDREQGIDKAGNRWVRAVMIELAWGWLRFQPTSAQTRWYQEKYGGGSPRIRKIGIVALARRILVDLWRWVEHDIAPKGAIVAAK